MILFDDLMLGILCSAIVTYVNRADDDIDKARDTMQELIDADDRILKDPASLIAVSELADSSVNFVVRVWVKSGDYSAVKFGMTEAIKKRFDKEGISFPYPQQDVHIHQAS